MVPLVAAGVAAGAQLLGSGAAAYAQGKMNKKTREWNEKMYTIQRDDMYEDWRVQNEYNDPSAQMERLRKAGLNPNLVYGNGATTTAAPVKSADMKSWSPQSTGVDVGGAAASGIRAYQDLTLQDEQVKNMQVQRRNMDLDTTLKTLQVAGDATRNAKDAFTLDQSKRLADTAVATAQSKLQAINAGTAIKITKEARDAAQGSANLTQALQKIADNGLNRDLKQAQLDNLRKTGVLNQLEIDMRKLGLSYNDSVILRMLSQFAEGKSLPELLKTAWNEIGNAAADNPISRTMDVLKNQKIYNVDFGDGGDHEKWAKEYAEKLKNYKKIW